MDDRGVVLDDLTAAVAHARQIARMIGAGAQGVWNWRQWTIDVASGDGPCITVLCHSLATRTAERPSAAMGA